MTGCNTIKRSEIEDRIDQEKFPDPSHVDEVMENADNIATFISGVLLKAFKDKEGRGPTPDEMESLFEELTEERINELMGKSNEKETVLQNISSGDRQESEDDDIDDDVHNQNINDSSQIKSVNANEVHNKREASDVIEEPNNVKKVRAES